MWARSRKTKAFYKIETRDDWEGLYHGLSKYPQCILVITEQGKIINRRVSAYIITDRAIIPGTWGPEVEEAYVLAPHTKIMSWLLLAGAYNRAYSFLEQQKMAEEVAPFLRRIFQRSRGDPREQVARLLSACSFLGYRAKQEEAVRLLLGRGEQ